jgi:uncharacterized protein (TIGR00369 family)
VTDAEMLEIFRRDRPPCLRTLNGMPEAVDQAAGSARIAFEAVADFCHSGDVVQGGFIAGMIDSAMAQAVLARTRLALSPPTLELKVSFFAPATPGRYRAEGRVTHMGQSIVFLEGDLRREDGVRIAAATATARLRPVDPARFPSLSRSMQPTREAP